MKKTVMSFFAVLLAGLAVLSGCQKESAAGNGKPEKTVVLYSSMTENDLNALLEGFGQKYPDVEVEVVNGSHGELCARIESEAGNPQGDLMWGALSAADGERYAAVFEKYLSPYEAEIEEAYKSPNGMYNLDHLSTAVFCVNTDLEKELGLDIRSYEDLLDPKLKGRIVFSDPNSSSAAWNNVSNIMAVYGNGSDEAYNFIDGLFKNGIVISTSSAVCFKGVQAGEYAVGLTYEDGASTLLKSGATNIRLQYPANGTSASAFGCAMIKGAKHPEAAKAMIDYLCSSEGQSFLGEKLGTLRFTNTKAVYDSPYLWKTSDIKWVTRDNAWLSEHKQEVLSRYNELFNKYH